MEVAKIQKTTLHVKVAGTANVAEQSEPESEESEMKHRNTEMLAELEQLCQEVKKLKSKGG